MTAAFYIAAFVAVVSTVFVVAGKNLVHALLCLVLSLLSVAVLLFLFGAPFAAALEVIVYAGAIVVMFVFVVMMLNAGGEGSQRGGGGLLWSVPIVLAAILFAEVVYILLALEGAAPPAPVSSPKEIGKTLFGPYLLGVEAAAMLLLAGLLGALRLGAPRDDDAGGARA